MLFYFYFSLNMISIVNVFVNLALWHCFSTHSWCPDCTAADPILEASMTANLPKGCVLLEMPVNRDEYRQRDTYLYRTTPEIKLACVPTLMRWQGGKWVARLNDQQCMQRAAVDEIFQME